MSEWVTIGSVDDIAEGALRGVRLDELWLAIARPVDGPLAAFQEWCTHEECQLSEGDLEGRNIVCYCHGASFDMETGAVVTGPATEPIEIYEIRAVEGQLQVAVESAPEHVRWTEWQL
jgi:nitrite reductase/ring-hydroxylating ferredoxin subunit